MPKYVIWRHGESESNATGDYDIFDPHLSLRGVSQCESAKKYASETPEIGNDFRDFDRLILVSHSTRAIETAKIIYPNDRLYGSKILKEYSSEEEPANMTRSIEELKQLYPNIDFETYNFDWEYKKEVCETDAYPRLIHAYKELRKISAKYNTIVLVMHGRSGKLLSKIIAGKDVELLRNAQCVVIKK
jgi:broad specificity phosphatase PhoE